MRAAVASLPAVPAFAQDPAHGWMAYAVGSIPDATERITRLEMTWTVGQDPPSSYSFFSPWFGMDPNDNLNLVQPVNPWGGDSWSMYTSYYQWSPSDNSNSEQKSVKAGQNLHGSIVYSESDDSYTLTQTVVETGSSSSQVVKAQNGKKYRIPYVVYEKLASCQDYPPDGKVTFRNIIIECDGKDCTQDTTWEAKVEDSNCDMRAVVDNGSKATSENSIAIEWDTSALSKYDNYTAVELLKLNSGGWGAKFAAAKLAELGEVAV